MSLQPSPQGTNRSPDDAGARRRGRHERPALLPARPVPDMIRNGSLERISAADQALADAHARLRAAGADSNVVRAAFAIAHDCLRDARDVIGEARRELALVSYEMDQERHGRRVASRPPAASAPVVPVVPDTPGLDLCPNPRAAQTSAEYMDALRRYRVWAGKPSYRAMQDLCGRRFATSTIHAALKADELPGLPMVHAVITACGGTQAHQQMFASAWRRLVMSAQDGADWSAPAAEWFPVAAGVQ